MEKNKYSVIGNNLSDKFEYSKKIKDLIYNIEGYPYNFIINILFNSTIVKIKGEKGYYLKNYSYKGTITKLSFLDNPNFIKAIKYTTRKRINTI
jgi:hypothetical protein